MSTSTVLADTLTVATEQGLSVELLPSWYDVDHPDDLRRLLDEVEAGHFCGPRTEAFLASGKLGTHSSLSP